MATRFFTQHIMIQIMTKGISVCSVSIEDLPIPAVHGGAIELIIENLVKNTRSIDWKVFSSDRYLKSSEKKRFLKTGHFFYYSLHHRSKRLLYALKNIIPEWAVYPHWITERMKKLNPDVVLLHNEAIYLKYILNIKKYLPETKVILFLHNDQTVDPVQSKNLKRYANQIDVIIGVSDYILKQTQKFVPDFPKSKMFCLHNASHLPVKPQKLKKSSFKTVLFVGRLTRYKGAYLLLQALAYVKDPSIRFIFVGSSHHGKDYIEPEFLDLKQSLSPEASKKLTLTGFIAPEKTKTYYDKADLVVFPSLWQEPSGLVLFEAWARGIPVLATNVGGIPELVNKFKHAQLVSPKISPQKLAAEIEALLKNKPKLKTLSKNGLMFAKNYGNFKRMAKELELILSSVLSDHSN